MLEATSTNRAVHSLPSVFIVFHLITFAIVNQIAPEPYIDEIFHYPQSLSYCQGQFYSWNDKITTPPGLYVPTVIE
jgi:alpha-1,2-glucosyltransferase